MVVSFVRTDNKHYSGLESFEWILGFGRLIYFIQTLYPCGLFTRYLFKRIGELLERPGLVHLHCFVLLVTTVPSQASKKETVYSYSFCRPNHFPIIQQNTNRFADVPPQLDNPPTIVGTGPVPT